MKQIILGITGTTCSGKGIVVTQLCEQYHFKHYSVTALLEKEIAQRALPMNRDSMRIVANDLRKHHGGDYLVRTLLDQAQRDGAHAIIESIRAPLEVDFLLQQGALLMSVDADPYQRWLWSTRRQSAKDAVTFETFMLQEAQEQQSTNRAAQNLHYCMQLTDPRFRLRNDGTLDEFKAAIDERMKVILEM